MERLRPNITVVGSLNMDIVVEAKRSPKQGETILGEQVHFIPGGKGANQAVAAARLGAKTRMIGAVGKDSFGETLLTSLQKEQIEVAGVKQIEDVPSGIASILLTERDNRIVVVPGANGQLSPADLDANRDSIKQAEILLLQLEIPLQTVEHAVWLAQETQTPVILNPAPAMKLSRAMLASVDLITPNLSELEMLTNQTVESEQDLEQAMSALMDHGPKHVVTTLGKEGAAFMDHERKLKKVASYPVDVVDTTGAGDAFNAALAYSIALQKPLEEAVTFATKVSALKVTKLGAQRGMPYMEEVERYPFDGS